MRRPAAARDISRNTESLERYSKSNPPIKMPYNTGNIPTRRHGFRITHCGHIFHQDALNTYLNDYDHRCQFVDTI